MQLRTGGLRVLVSLHLGVFALTAIAGGRQATGSLAGRPAGSLFDEAARIASNNLGALTLLVVANLVLVGVVSMVLFGFHGYLFGQMLSMTHGPTVWVLLYAPLEIFAFALGASASTGTAVGLLTWLHSGEPAPLRVIARLASVLLVTVICLLAAALLESVAIRGAWG